MLGQQIAKLCLAANFRAVFCPLFVLRSLASVVMTGSRTGVRPLLSFSIPGSRGSSPARESGSVVLRVSSLVIDCIFAGASSGSDGLADQLEPVSRL